MPRPIQKRIRSVRPEFWRSLSLARVSRDARLLCIGLFSEADDDGFAQDDPRLAKTAAFPFDDDLTTADVERLLSDLAATETLCRYEVDGERFLHFPKWTDYQRVEKPTRTVRPPCPVHSGGLAPVVPISPAAQPVRITNPRRCPAHQTGQTGPCGACREARLAYEEAQKSKPTLSAKTTMCGEHPEHRALRCPVCAAQAVPAPVDLRSRGRKKHTS